MITYVYQEIYTLKRLNDENIRNLEYDEHERDQSYSSSRICLKLIRINKSNYRI